MNEQEIRTLTKQVEFIMQEIPKTRDSDKLLTIEVWQRFYPQWIRNGLVPLMNIMDLPSQDGIKRVRANIQNVEHRLPPTSWKVAEARHWLIEDWQSALGYLPQRKKEPVGLLEPII